MTTKSSQWIVENSLEYRAANPSKARRLAFPIYPSNGRREAEALALAELTRLRESDPGAIMYKEVCIHTVTCEKAGHQ